ncbi:TetR/AcrR family transcriptional regulator [Actinomadura rupiterrae]|uniref:TetR/AcrR family transcriptional regulator n=1 Tax=Actinomadura rupiterrae TaxID=559627 RepID=UPI0020A595DE|nr:TetR/AcrR family transcriptional regulator [Actinomadura rupiterrae]MCP2335668.1 TetR/AcrR family transcriptional repressor of nem operon [Actinomadura rupiterrae]
MARTKEFDPDTALRRALELFWERGYEGTSMADLVERTGVARASLYATFGGKHDLYVKALELYAEDNAPRLLDELSNPGPVLPQVRAVVRRFAAESSSSSLRGCLVVNTAVELAARDGEAARKVEASWTNLEALLTSALVRARAQGELAADRDPRALARMLLVLMQGMRVLGRAPGGEARLRDAADQALTLLT